MKINNMLKKICALMLVLVLVSTQMCASIVAFATAPEPAVVVGGGGPRLVAETQGMANPSYQWQRATSKDGEYSDIKDANSKYYNITAADKNHFIRVVAGGETSEPTANAIGELIYFDLSQATVVLDSTYSGKDSNGDPVTGTHVASNIYIVQQSDTEEYTTNCIKVNGNHTDTTFDVTIDGVHMGSKPVLNKQPNSSGIGGYGEGTIDLQPENGVGQKNVTLRFKGENIVRAIHYYAKGDYANSSLKLTDINGDGEYSGGQLYVPIKVDIDKIDEFVNSGLSYNHWNSAIGGDDGSGDAVNNLEIAGGKLQVLTTYADNCSAIGAGGNGPCNMLISGGYINAHCNGTGTAIGGGIGWHSGGGSSNVTITGGTVYAENHGKIYAKIERDENGEVVSSQISTIDDYTDLVGGVAIGSGSSFEASGSKGIVTITGGNVTAVAAYGNGIGGGNSSYQVGGDAEIAISGGTVKATSIGGGNSQNGEGGYANVTVNSPANVTIDGTIGGGDSAYGDGGEAKIIVNGGTMNCGGTIGGGNGGHEGNGGKAIVTVKAGTLTADAIGGGVGGVSGNGGAAEIYIDDGVIETGSIGGGDTLNKTNGKLGYAKAVIKGGDIKGQFLMAAGGTEPCTFDMSGGVLHGVNALDTEKYTKANGAAVYMDDQDGVVTITGGTIRDCVAEKGGAVYMTAGTFVIGNDAEETADATKAIITNCSSEEEGGAVYLGGGKMIIKNNAIISDNESGASGGAAYVGGGNVEVRGGQIFDNTAENNGGAIAVADGNYLMYGGSVTSNEALKGNGGGIYVSSETVAVDVQIRSGEVSDNSANLSGGAVAVVGKDTDDAKLVTTTIGVKDVHYEIVNGKYVRVACEHAPNGTDVSAEACPVFKNNSGDKNGGAIYISGNDQAKLNIYCLLEEGSVSGSDKNQSDFLKVEGGCIVLSTSEVDDPEEQDSLHGNIQINSSIYATNGKFDIYGSMENPLINKIMTVDIEDTKNDHFNDWRIQESYYKLLYYENFIEPGETEPSGQYKEKHILMGDSEVISGNIYEHPGYEIVGWNTDPKGLDNWDQGDRPNDTGYYDVGKSYKFDGKPIGDLIIYAIWKANGYEVYYKPNCDSFSGEMPISAFEYDKEAPLDENKFVRDGYHFVGWSLKAEPGDGDKIYEDKAVVKNLTTKRGVVVYLYAQWEKCNHNYDEHEYSYKVVNGVTIERTCSCNGYVENATIVAQDSVYSRDAVNPAKVVFTYDWKEGVDEDVPANQGFSPKIKYTKDGNSFEGTPKNAGEYTATITATDDDDKKHTASLTYTIEKAEQPAPEKPVYDAAKDGDLNVLKVKPVAGSKLGDPSAAEYDSTYDSVPRYKLEYYEGNEKKVVGWYSADEIDDAYARIFELNNAFTKYSIYARYSEGTNYKASDEVKADRDYLFAGDVELSIICGQNVDYDVLTSESNNPTNNGIELKIWTEENAYFPTGYGLDIETYYKENPTQERPAGEQADINPGTVSIDGSKETRYYTIIKIKEKSLIKVTIPDAKLIPVVNGKVTEKEVFGSVTTSAAKISRDSAYTAFFEVKNYDTAEYTPLTMEFSKPLPAGTTIILLDKDTKEYFGHTVYNTSEQSVSLNEFVKMGTHYDNFSLRNGAMNLQFVVDFSDVEDGISGADIDTSLVAERDANGYDFLDVESKVKTALENVATYGLTVVKDGLDSKLTHIHNVSKGVTSKWDNSHTAIVLTPKTEIPTDAYISFVGKQTSHVYRNAQGNFVVPIGALDGGNLKVSLVSSQFTDTVESFGFTATWIAANSKADAAPMNGTILATVDISLDGEKVAPISMKVTADKKAYDAEEDTAMAAVITWEDLPLYCDAFDVTLMYKNDNGNYVTTGWKESIDYDESYGSATVNVPIANQNHGSYYLRVTAESGLRTLIEVDYDFIVK